MCQSIFRWHCTVFSVSEHICAHACTDTLTNAARDYFQVHQFVHSRELLEHIFSCFFVGSVVSFHSFICDDLFKNIISFDY